MFLHALDDRAISRLTAKVSGRLAEAGHTVAILSAGRREEPTAEAVSVPRGVAQYDLRSGDQHTARATRAFSQFAAQWKPDVVFAHRNGPARTAIVGRALTRSRTRIVTVQHTHATTFDRVGPIRHMITSALLPRADLVTAVGPYVLEDLISHYPRVAGKTAVLPPVGPEPAEVSSAIAEVPDHPWFRGKERPFIVTCVGNLVERKGQATLVDALPMLRSTLGDVRLVLVGREDDETFARRLRSAALVAGVEQHVWWAGYIRDPLPIIARSNVFAITSHSEGGPMVVLEAMACGVPVVSSDCPAGPRYLLDEGRAGVLVPVGDAAAVAAAIGRLASDEDLRAEFVRRGLERVAVFEPRKVARLYAQAAGRVCDSPADARGTVRLA